MTATPPEPDLPPAWREALARAAVSRRVLVLGATDMGKTTFIRALLEAREQPARLIDLDPGQKMLGPPGIASVGRLDRVERFIFLGTTSASGLSAIAAAARALGEGTEPFVVNTAGFVVGLGARLQAMTAAAIKPELIVEIGAVPILSAPEAEVIRLAPSRHATRKTAGLRAALRRTAFEGELEGATLLPLPLEGIDIRPGPLAPWETAARPVCSLADGTGEDMALGVIERVDPETLQIRSHPPPRAVRYVRIGKMWAEPGGGGWRLIERLSPSWGPG